MGIVAPKTALVACAIASIADLLAVDFYFGPRALAPSPPAPVVTASATPPLRPAPSGEPARAPVPEDAPPPVEEPAADGSEVDASGRVTGIVARFESEQANADLEQLRKLAAELVADPTAEVVLEGHSDANGNEYYNLSLSLDRANWARDRLAELGVPRSRVRTVGLGSARPLDATGASPKNRRVEVRWLPRTRDAGGDAWTP